MVRINVITCLIARLKITTYKSLKWHMLVLYLNIDGIDGDDVSLEDDIGIYLNL